MAPLTKAEASSDQYGETAPLSCETVEKSCYRIANDETDNLVPAEACDNDDYVWVLEDMCYVSVNETVIRENVGRISKIEKLERCPNLKSLILTAQKIEHIEGLDQNPHLEQLELYQNRIREIKNVQHLVKLKILDLSFNRISVIENLDALVNLQRLFLTSNKLEKIQNVDKLTELQEIELGSNRIRVIENLEHLTKLKSLWLGKNKITEMTLPSLPCLEALSIQSNRLTRWDSSLFESCPQLVELYLSHNDLQIIPSGISSLKRLRVLDLAGNRINSLENLSDCVTLNELWLNDNLIRRTDNIQYLVPLKKLETLYLERNPIQTDTGPGYIQTVLSVLHWLKQLDALCVSEEYTVKNSKAPSTS